MPQLAVQQTATGAPVPSSGPVSKGQYSWPSALARRVSQLALLFAVWLAIFAGSLATPPLLDDADATHAQAAQSLLSSGDWVTLHVDGVRYLEKAPLPYWIAALSLRVFGNNAFAVHLPLALTVLALALLGYAWTRRAFAAFVWDDIAAFYAALFTLTSLGVFLFTRIFIPDAMLSLLLGLTLYQFLLALNETPARSAAARPYFMWFTLALAVLTKGLVALVFFFGAAAVFLLLTHQLHRLHRLRPVSGLLLFLAVAAPWHVLAALRNRGSSTGHGFLWFYFVNEHFLRFLGRRFPDDYNKLPALLYWSLHLVWLFPWSLFAPAAVVAAWRRQREMAAGRDRDAGGELLSRFQLAARRRARTTPSLATQSVLLLAVYSAIVLIFFAFSTNQEYYTFPAYLPLLMLLAAAVAMIEHRTRHGLQDRLLAHAMTFAYAAFSLVGLAAAITLAWGLWTSRHLPFGADIGARLAHRGVGNYTLSLSHFFDLTGPSFAALRLPSALALAALLLGPALAWILHGQRKPRAAVLSVAFTSTVFLIAAHLALVRFTPMLSSQDFAQRILDLERSGALPAQTVVLLYGDQSFGSSLPFYLGRQVLLVNGRSTSMLFGSTFPEASAVFLTDRQLLESWGHGPRKILFVPFEKRTEVDHLLGPQQTVLAESSGKALLTDRPLTIR